MAARLDYAVSVTPIQQGSLEGTVTEAVDAEIGRSLGGGSSITLWTGGAIPAWADGAHVHVEAHGAAFVQVGEVADDMVWIKHTGKRFDSATTDKLKADGTADATAVSVYSGVADSEVELCQLLKGEAIVLPLVKAKLWIKSTATTGTAPAVEYAKFQ